MRPLLAAARPCALLLFLLAGALQSPTAESSGAAAGRTEWQVVARANFSSQIRLHPHVLLLVTMPWYGESRSLMVEIEHLVASNEQELGHLKLMVVYRNSEKLLTDAIGATEGIKFLYYQRSVPFKYQGKLRARDILSSVQYIMSLKHEEAPFQILNTKEDVDAFIESTDKSVLLYESCGWFTRLVHGGSNRSYEAASSKDHTANVDISGMQLTRESDGPLELVIEDEELTLGGGDQLTGSPWKGGFALANESVSEQTENTNAGSRQLCTVQKFHQFEGFYKKLTAIAREYFLPPEKMERAINPSCSIIVKEGDDLRSQVQSHDYLGIKEVGVHESGGEAIFPADRPSVILFIDRLSHSSKVRDESKLALKLLRLYVQNNYPFHVSAGAVSSGNSRMSSKPVPSLMNTGISDAHSETARLNAWASKLMALGDKMSVMVVNDGESISYRASSQEDSVGNPLYDILTKLLHKTRPDHRSKKTRISLVTKDVDLKLLPDDSNVHVVESLSVKESQQESTDDSFGTSDNFNDNVAEVSVDENKATEIEYVDDGQAPSKFERTPAPDEQNIDLASNVAEMEDQSKSESSDMASDHQEEVSYDVYSSSEEGHILHEHKEEKSIAEALDMLKTDERNMQANQEASGSPIEKDYGSLVLGQKSRRIEDVIFEDNTFNLYEGSEESDSKCPPHADAACSFSSSLVRDDTDNTEQVTSNRFAGSFYFSDGGDRLLRTLTSVSRIPSLVIIDPVQQKNYVFPEESEFSYASLQNYFDSFMNQSLPSYHRAASSAKSSKELPRPPFVNHDFREANSIPQLTTNSFCPLVFGFRGCESNNEMPLPNTENLASGWNKDVLVLFSNSWCGFCQRAELVVRELHQSFKNFMIYSDSVFANAQDVHNEETNEAYTMEGFPAIYTIDCTSNECRHLLKYAGMEELYPTLLLFPAENKSAIAYGGGMSVANLIEFLESRVRNSRHLLEYKGFLWKKRMATHHDAPQAIQFPINETSRSSVGYDLPSYSDVATGSILTATEKLETAVPFDDSRVLVVSADSHDGFIGLIINKRLSWGVFKNLDGTMEPIKRAPLFYGGPVVVQGYHLVNLSRVAFEGYMQVIPGVYYGDIIATSRVITRIKSGEQSADDLWFFLGYSGWGYSQLFDELSEGAWHVSEKPIEHLDWPES
ncbi:hypothetical protein ACP70R_019098 [Stipagrostis hirtigluma subsp. patula]